MGFRFIRPGHLEVLQRADHGAAGGIKEGFFVGAVKNEKGFVLIPGAEVTAQKWKHAVFRFDLAAQYAAQFGKTDKPFQQMGLAVEMPHGGKDRGECFVGNVTQKRRTVL